MSQEKVRIGIIGVGQIGKHHLDNYAKLDTVELVAAADLNEAEVERVAEKYGIPNTYTDFRKLLERDDLDAVDVCLHNNFHMPVVVEVLRSGKHVYCEKPMAGAYTDAARMLEVAREVNRLIHIQTANLYFNETKVAKQLIDDGQLGKLYHARSYGHRRRGRPFVDGYGTPTFVQKRNSGGGALYDMGVYHINTIMYLLGNPAVERISGKAYQETAINATRQEKSGYDVEELGLGFVRLADNKTLDIMESWAVHMDQFPGSMILGSEGGIRLAPFGFFRSDDNLDYDITINMGSYQWRSHTVHEIGDVYDSSQEHWVAALQGRVDLLNTAEVALNTMLISEGIYLSSKLGREVTADEVVEMSVSTAVKV